MKFAEPRPFVDVNAAVKNLLEITNAIEADQLGRIHIRPINSQFLAAGGSVAEYRDAIKDDRGLISAHSSGAYISFTQAGADIFA